MGPFINMELNFNGARVNNGRGTGHLDTYGYSVDVLGILNRTGLISPYLTAGVGAESNVQVPGNPLTNQTKLMTQAGVGTYINLWRSADGTSAFSLRPEVKARWDDPGKGDHLVDYIAMMGFQFSFGGSRTPAPPLRHRLRHHRRKQHRHLRRPPRLQPRRTAIMTACRTTSTSVRTHPPGVQVDAVGCPLKGSITLEGVNFEYNSAALTVASHAPLDAVADGLKKHPRLKVEIQGHTDSTGSRRIQHEAVAEARGLGPRLPGPQRSERGSARNQGLRTDAAGREQQDRGRPSEEPARGDVCRQQPGRCEGGRRRHDPGEPRHVERRSNARVRASSPGPGRLRAVSHCGERRPLDPAQRDAGHRSVARLRLVRA